MIDLDTAKNYLRVDNQADDTLITTLIEAATLQVEEATGYTSTSDSDEDPRIEIAILSLVAFYFENRGTQAGIPDYITRLLFHLKTYSSE